MKTRRRLYHSPEKRENVKNSKSVKKVIQKPISSISTKPSLSFTDETKNLFRQTRYRFKRRKIRCFYPYEVLFADSIVYRTYWRQNSGFKYIVIVIDCFTKMAYAEAVKKLDEFSVTLALENIFKKLPDLPRYFCTDRGTEFMNAKVQNLMLRKGIIHYQMRGRHKAAIAERYIRTLKSNLEKYFWQNKTNRWLDVYQSYIRKYNSSYHRSIRMRPDQVNWENRQTVFRSLFPKTIGKRHPRIKTGTKVRLVKFKHVLEKGYTRRWSLQLFKVISSESRGGVDFYKIADLEGNILPGKKYYWEINPINKLKNARLRGEERRLGNSNT